MEWDEFVGKTVVEVQRNEDTTLLVFRLSDGRIIFASATGGCCSRSWFEAVEGLDALIGEEITAAVEREMPGEKRDESESYCLQFYGWTLETKRGRFDIEMRNESNGYYGGEVRLSYEYALDQYGEERPDSEKVLVSIAAPRPPLEG